MMKNFKYLSKTDELKNTVGDEGIIDQNLRYTVEHLKSAD